MPPTIISRQKENKLRVCTIIAIFIACVGYATANPPQEYEPFSLSFIHFDGKRQGHILKDFDGDGLTDILVSSINFDYDPPVRWLSVFFQQAGGRFHDTPDQTFQLKRNASALVYGNFLRRNATEIGYVAGDGVYYYPLDPREKKYQTTPRKLIHTETFLTTSSQSAIPILHPSTDIDGNGLDDLMVPVPDGYKIYLQTEPGVFGKISRITLKASHYAEEEEINAVQFVAGRTLPRLEVSDVNGDGRKDLINVQGMLITYFFQGKDGTFGDNAAFRYNLRDLKDPVEKDKVTLSRIAFTDINNDNKADLIVVKTGGMAGDFQTIKTQVMVYIGNGSGRFLRLDAKIVLDGISIDPELVDVNGDGKKDIFLSSVRADLLDLGKSYLLQAVEMKFYLYVFDAALDNYPEGGPEFTYNTSINIKDIEEAGIDGVPRIYVRADHSGDGRPDMVKINPDRSLEIRQGRKRMSLGKIYSDFSNGPFYRITLSRLPKSVEMTEINGDSVCDILLIHNGAIGVLMSRP